MYRNNRMYQSSYYGDILSDDLDNDRINENNWTYKGPSFNYDHFIPLEQGMEYDFRRDTSQVAGGSNQLSLKDYGPQPLVINIEKATEQNNTFRTALWTGEHFQVTLMSIKVGDDIGLEIHPDTDQFIRIEEGQAIVRMGTSRDRLEFQANARDGFAIIIPAGIWHNVINTGNKPLKVYSIYAPPKHPFGVVQMTKSAE